MIIYSTYNLKKLTENVKNKKVLILGSGPSATEVDWELADYEKIVSTSFFYLNDKVLKMDLCHVSLSKLVNLKDERLLKFLRNNKKTTISFEPKISKFLSKKTGQKEEEIIHYVKKSHNFYNSLDFKNFYDEFSKRIFFYRSHSGLEGLAGRIFWPIADSKPKTVYFCGLDGISKSPEKDPQNYFRNHRGTTDKHYTYESYKLSFEEYAKKMYTYALEKGIKVINLGKGKDYNLISPISMIYEKGEA